MKYFFLIGILSLASSVNAQTTDCVSLEDCYNLARQNYPLIKQQELIQKSKKYSIENISKGYLPQFAINGQATYQSDVTEIPVKLPNTTIPSLSKDQYKI